jgi:hypothetical protein
MVLTSKMCSFDFIDRSMQKIPPYSIVVLADGNKAIVETLRIVSS